MQIRAKVICKELRNMLSKETEGIIFSVFDHAINIVTSNGLLFTLLTEKISEQPYSILLDYTGSFQTLVKPKEHVQILLDSLVCGNTCVSLLTAADWEEQIRFVEPILRKETISQRVSWIPGLIEKEGSVFGLAPVLWMLPQLYDEKENQYSLKDVAKSKENMYSSCALKAIENLLEKIRESDMDGKWEIPKPLIGLGPGVTPSGDDFFAGVMSAALYFQYYQHRKLDAQIRENKIRLKKQKDKTNLISENMLLLAAEGKISACFHRGIRSLFSGEEKTCIELLKEVMKYGASSGSDFLAGVYAYLHIQIIE